MRKTLIVLALTLSMTVLGLGAFPRAQVVITRAAGSGSVGVEAIPPVIVGPVAS